MAGKYQRTLVRVFEKKVAELEKTVEGDIFEEDIPFHRKDIERAIDELDIKIGNVPDIPYAYRSRRDLPPAIAKHGYNAVIIDDNRPGEDPTYLFTKQEQLIEVPENPDETRSTNWNELPAPVREYIREDEQGVLTQIRYTDLIDTFTGLDCYHLSSHVRFRVQGREAELDDLYIGVDEDGNHYALTVEAKGKGETLNRNQLIRNTRGIRNRDQYPNSVRSLAVKLHEDGGIYLFEFDVYKEGSEDSIEVKRVWECKIQ